MNRTNDVKSSEHSIRTRIEWIKRDIVKSLTIQTFMQIVLSGTHIQIQHIDLASIPRIVQRNSRKRQEIEAVIASLTPISVKVIGVIDFNGQSLHLDASIPINEIQIQLQILIVSTDKYQENRIIVNLCFADAIDLDRLLDRSMLYLHAPDRDRQLKAFNSIENTTIQSFVARILTDIRKLRFTGNMTVEESIVIDLSQKSHNQNSNDTNAPVFEITRRGI